MSPIDSTPPRCHMLQTLNEQLSYVMEILYCRDSSWGLSDNQEEISERWKAWENLPIRLFGSSHEKLVLRSAAIREGAFRLFVTERDKGDWALFQMLSHPEFEVIRRRERSFRRGAYRSKRHIRLHAPMFAEESVSQSDADFQSPVSAHELSGKPRNSGTQSRSFWCRTVCPKRCSIRRS